MRNILAPIGWLIGLLIMLCVGALLMLLAWIVIYLFVWLLHLIHLI